MRTPYLLFGLTKEKKILAVDYGGEALHYCFVRVSHHDLQALQILRPQLASALAASKCIEKTVQKTQNNGYLVGTLEIRQGPKDQGMANSVMLINACRRLNIRNQCMRATLLTIANSSCCISAVGRFSSLGAISRIAVCKIYAAA